MAVAWLLRSCHVAVAWLPRDCCNVGPQREVCGSMSVAGGLPCCCTKGRGDTGLKHASGKTPGQGWARPARPSTAPLGPLPCGGLKC
eukprot:365722-Chlamydomonas_euryale.AAC.2